MELVLKLMVPAVILIAALVQWGLDHWWNDRTIRVRRRWAFTLMGIIALGAVVNGVTTVHTHEQVRSERARTEEVTRQREQRARQERHEIAQRIGNLVHLARERDPNLTEQEALRQIGAEVHTLRKKTSDLEQELRGFRRYNNVASLGVLGLPDKLKAGSGITMTSRLSLALEGAYEETEDGKVRPSCNKKAIAAFEEAATINPDFPFTYWARATCALKARKPEWQGYAERATEIFEQTTQISGHNPGHDQALQDIHRLVAVEQYLRRDYTAAFDGLHPLAGSGNPDAQFLLGYMYEFGQGVPMNEAAAVRWYRRAAEQGNTKAQARLERMHANGMGDPKNTR